MNINSDKEKLVAIHQPNFFPWQGYFDKIIRSDIFILLDNVQFPKTGGTWTNRVRILMNGSPAWVTMPIARSFSGTRLVCEMEINNSSPWRNKLLHTLRTNYAKALFFKDTFPFISELVNNPTSSLASYNISAIQTLAETLGIRKDKVVLGSSLNVEGKATDLLIALTKAVSGTTYLCGGGANGYQEDAKLAEAQVKLIYQNFSNPQYKQHGVREFVPGLSIMDALFNIGIQGTKEILLVNDYKRTEDPEL